MTPQEAYDFLSPKSPVEIKNHLLGLLAWQAKRGKPIIHFTWYLLRLKEPKLKPWPDDLRPLLRGIGG